MEQNVKTVTMYGADWCKDCRRAEAFMNEHGIEFNYIDLIAQPDMADVAEEISGRKNIPVVVFPDDSHLVEPSNDELAASLRANGLLAD